MDSVRAMGDLLMPRACLVCGCRLGLRERHLCLACAADVPYTRYWLQPHNPLADRFNAVLERHRGTEPMDYAYATALMHYKGGYRAIPRALKYHADLAAGRHYGALLGRRLASAPHLADIDLVIPVPLHWTRLHSRGYNQSAILAHALVSVPWTDLSPVCRTDLPPAPWTDLSPVCRTDLPPAPRTDLFPVCRTDLLVRSRRTKTQTRLTVEQKAQNVASAFHVPERFSLWARLVSRLVRLVRPFGPKRFQGVSIDALQNVSMDAPDSPAKVLASARHILLVDDTFTTGATLYACYAALRPYTTARISIATLAAVEGTPSETVATTSAPPARPVSVLSSGP